MCLGTATNVRNGFSMPLRLGPRMAIDSALHPRWLLGTIGHASRQGSPHFENLDAHRGAPMLSRAAGRGFNNRDKLSWRHIEAVRRRWKGNLVTKGLLAAEDARLAREAGCDGIIVSSHGGRQLDHAIAPIRVLPEMVEAGRRHGRDDRRRHPSRHRRAEGARPRRKARLGRGPMLYAAVVGSPTAVTHAIALLAAEIDRDLALMGLTSLSELSPAAVRWRGR